MSNRPLKPYDEGGASVDLPIDAILDQAGEYMDQITDAVAREVLKRAKTSSEFTDKTGKLRKSGRRRKSRFNIDEQIVAFTAQHAHLVEHGHVMLNKHGEPTVLGHVPVHPFLGPARDSVENDLPTIINRVAPLNIKVGC